MSYNKLSRLDLMRDLNKQSYYDLKEKREIQLISKPKCEPNQVTDSYITFSIL
jgi:hypothetical protein